MISPPVRRRIMPWLSLGSACGLAFGLTACVPGASIIESILNNTASLGRPTIDEETEDDTPGLRADISVRFVNNTPYRAVFTFGTYDPLNTDQESDTRFPIKYQQFFVADDVANRLDGFSESEVITFTAGDVSGDPGGCGRAISLGGDQLVQLLEENRSLFETSASGEAIHDEALWPVCDPATNQPRAGIGFFKETSPGPEANACDSADEIAAWADGVLTLQGAEYPCGATVVYTFREDSTRPGGVRVDVTVEEEEEEEDLAETGNGS